jgi:putative peptide zinc metalloprotease protein
LIEPVSTIGSQWDIDSPSVLDTSEGKKSYLLRSDNGAQVKVSASAYSLLRAIHSGMSFADVAEVLNNREGQTKVSGDNLKAKYESLVARLNTVEAQSARQNLPWGFWFRFRLVPESTTARIASVLSILYHPAIVAVVVLVFIGSAAVAIHHGFPIIIQQKSFLPGIGLFLAILFVHEFGHASACARYGAKPSDIGFTAYLIYPAFYSDVSSAWKLSRFQRVVVDLGGCYFQGIATIGLFFAFYSSNWEPLRVAIIFSLSSALFSLNPVFKFDGYWVLADSLGVANLSTQPTRIRQFLRNKLLRRPTEQLPWPTSIIAVLTVYSALTVVVWIYFVIRLLPTLVLQSVVLAHASSTFAVRTFDGKLPTWSNINEIISSGAFLLFVVLMLWNIIKIYWYSTFYKIKPRVRTLLGLKVKNFSDQPVIKF